jgi:hypothetical protein
MSSIATIETESPTSDDDETASDLNSVRMDESLMPRGHWLLWKYLKESWGEQIVVAGSFAAAQRQSNMTGRNFSYNDIDFWVMNERFFGGMTESLLRYHLSK